MRCRGAKRNDGAITCTDEAKFCRFLILIIIHLQNLGEEIFYSLLYLKSKNFWTAYRVVRRCILKIIPKTFFIIREANLIWGRKIYLLLLIIFKSFFYILIPWAIFKYIFNLFFYVNQIFVAKKIGIIFIKFLPYNIFIFTR